MAKLFVCFWKRFRVYFPLPNLIPTARINSVLGDKLTDFSPLPSFNGTRYGFIFSQLTSTHMLPRILSQGTGTKLHTISILTARDGYDSVIDAFTSATPASALMLVGQEKSGRNPGFSFDFYKLRSYGESVAMPILKAFMQGSRASAGNYNIFKYLFRFRLQRIFCGCGKSRSKRTKEARSVV